MNETLTVLLWCTLAFVVLMLISAAIIIPFSIAKENKRAKCDAAGGIFFEPKYETFCLKRDAVIFHG